MRLAAALFLTAAALSAQQRTVHISTPQPTVVAGRTVQVSATLRDAQGSIVPNTSFTWQSSNTSTFTVDQNGVVTARRPGIANVGATSGGVTSTIQIQVLPLRIEVTPTQKIIKVGETVQYSARALDADEKPIEGINFTWNTVGTNGSNINAARMDGAGMLFTNAIAKVTVRAVIGYGNPGAQFISQFVGTARLEIKPAESYRITRLLASDEAPTSVRLRLSPTQMSVTEGGTIAFLSNLDGYSTGVLLYENGRLEVLASTGAPKPLYGGQITDFGGVAVNQRGQVLTYATGPNVPNLPNSNGLVLISREGTRPLLVSGSDSINIGPNAVSRYSLNDRGDAVVLGSFAGSPLLLRLANGSVELLANGGTSIPGMTAPFSFEEWGIDAAGDIYFRARNASGQAIYRNEPFSVPARIIGTGDTVAGGQIRNLNGFALSQSGEIAVRTDAVGSGDQAIVRIPKAAAASQWQVLPVTCCGGLRSIGPAGVLFDGAQGLYRWQGSAVTLALPLNRPGPGGEPLTSVQDATITASGAVIAQVLTPSGVLFLRDGAILADSTTRVEGPGLFSLQSFVPGARTGPVHILMDGAGRSVFELDALGLIPRLLNGDRLADSTPGSRIGSVRKTAAGDLYATWSGNRIFKIANGAAAAQFSLPPCEGNVCIFFNSLLGANESGTVLWTGNGNNGVNRLYLTRNNQHTLLTYWAGISGAAPGPAGGVVRNVNAALDGRGRVIAWITAEPLAASGLFLFEDGRWQRLLAYGGPLLDLPEVTQAAPVDTADDGFFLQLGSRYDGTLLARWRSGNWEKLIARQDLAATGGQINNVQRVRANSADDAAVLLQWNGNSGLAVRLADGSWRAVATLGDALPDGSYLAEVIDFDFRDDGRLYFLVRDFDDRALLYVAEPL